MGSFGGKNTEDSLALRLLPPASLPQGQKCYGRGDLNIIKHGYMAPVVMDKGMGNTGGVPLLPVGKSGRG